jgi:hypothetical protein
MTGLDVMSDESLRVAARLNKLLLEGEIKDTKGVVEWYRNELITIGMVQLHNVINQDPNCEECKVWGLK